MFYQKPKCQDVEYLEFELEREREDRRRMEEEADERRRQRDEECRKRAEYDARHAESWPEALRKQMYLLRNEAIQWPGDDIDFPDNYFGPGAEACQRALEIWKEVESANTAKIVELEAQIKAIRDGIKTQVADQLESEGNDKPNGWRHVVAAIREEDYNSWLEW